MKELGGLKVGNLFHLKARARQASLSKQRGFAALAARRSLQGGGSRAMGAAWLGYRARTSHLSESAFFPFSASPEPTRWPRVGCLVMRAAERAEVRQGLAVRVPL